VCFGKSKLADIETVFSPESLKSCFESTDFADFSLLQWKILDSPEFSRGYYLRNLLGFCVTNLTTVVSVFAGTVFLHEPFSLVGLLCCVLILIGIYGIQCSADPSAVKERKLT
jgi:hypothetical protein